jgi:DNA-directed RNA polymerase specialized sigma24 family protein
MASPHNHENSREEFASASDVREFFHEHRTELQWLAHFISANRAVAEACVSEACALSESATNVFKEWLATWARYSTIRSAVQSQRSLIGHLAPKYQRSACRHSNHQPLSLEALELVVEESEVFISRLDVISRTALVMCGIEGHSLSDVAVMLGISRPSVQGAYCAALDWVEIVRCQCLASETGNAAMCN